MVDTDSTPGAPRDFGRRLSARREALGLTVDQVAERAGLERDHLLYCEEQSAVPTPDDLPRLATALETSVENLLDAGAEDGADERRLERLSHRSSLVLLERGGVGRMAMTRVYAPVVLPVNFALVDGDIVIRTHEASQIARAAAAGDRVSFEVDELHEATRDGWSVVATGRLERVSEEEAERLREAVSAWAGDRERQVVVRLRPVTLTGRRISAA